MIASLALRYLAVFAIVLAALSAGAYEFLSREYAALLGPALGTPEASAAYAAAMRRVAETIVAFDIPLLAVFGAAAWFMAGISLRPLIAAQERERAFAADAAHALRTPLATIAGVAQARRADAGGEDAQAYETISRAALDASAVVGDLLTLARSAHAHGLSKEPMDLAAVVADTAREFRQAAQARHIELQDELQSAIVDGDERRVRELTRNLLSNALRHARTAIRLRVAVRGSAAELVVSNDGEAVGDESKEKIFERFYRADGAADGTGLGLAIVRWIANAHGGTAMVRDCASGQGAEFVVTLPLLRG
jgi:signal transduction histidine kinase